MATECQRSVLSCSRCRRRKVKCDRRLPSCSQCLAAKTPCAGFASAAAHQSLPRSIVHQLELDIARLETDLAQAGHLDVLDASDVLLQMPLADRDPRAVDVAAASSSPPRRDAGPQHPRRQGIVAGEELHAMIMATAPSASALTDLVSRIRMGLTPSSAEALASADSRRRSNVVTTTPLVNTRNAVLASLPNHLVHSLVGKFVHTILPQYPFLRERDVWHQLDSVMRTLHAQQAPSTDAQLLTVAADHDFLTIYLTLAISVTLGSARGNHEGRCLAFSVSLFEEGIQHFLKTSCPPSDLAAIQNTLLILLYAQINPRSANVWILSGAAIRSCLELGLHRESLGMAAANPEDVTLRRHIFWSAYCMDRAVCAALRRPLSVPDAGINTPLPLLDSQSTGSVSHAAFLRWIQLHQLQSALIQVHFQGAPLPDGMTWDGWLISMEAHLRAWHARWCAVSPSTPGMMDESDTADDFALSRGLAYLHRPSPRIPLPSQHSLLVAFSSAVDSAKAAARHIASGFFRRPWFAAHHTMETAMIVLFALRHAASVIREKFSAKQVWDMTKLFTSNFLAIAAQGWTEVEACAGVYERLLGPLLEHAFAIGNGEDQEETLSRHFGPQQDAELIRLLYPGPAQTTKLRFGARRTAEAGDLFPFDLSIFGTEDELFNATISGDFNRDSIPADAWSPIDDALLGLGPGGTRAAVG